MVCVSERVVCVRESGVRESGVCVRENGMCE